MHSNAGAAAAEGGGPRPRVAPTSGASAQKHNTSQLKWLRGHDGRYPNQTSNGKINSIIK